MRIWKNVFEVVSRHTCSQEVCRNNLLKDIFYHTLIKIGAVLLTALTCNWDGTFLCDISAIDYTVSSNKDAIIPGPRLECTYSLANTICLVTISGRSPPPVSSCVMWPPPPPPPPPLVCSSHPNVCHPIPASACPSNSVIDLHFLSSIILSIGNNDVIIPCISCDPRLLSVG